MTTFDDWAASSRVIIEHELALLDSRAGQLRALLDTLGAEPPAPTHAPHAGPTNGARSRAPSSAPYGTIVELAGRVLRDGMTMPEIMRAVMAIQPDARPGTIRTAIDWLRTKDRVRTDGIGTARRYYHAP